MAEEVENDQQQKHERSCFIVNLPSLLSIFLPMVAFGILITRAASFSSKVPFTISNDATTLSKDFLNATKEDISNYILLYWYDNMFCVPRAIFTAAVLHANVILLPKTFKLVMLCTTIPAHPISDWIENTAAIMAYLSFSTSETQMVDEYWLKQYYTWRTIKLTFLIMNAIIIFAGFALNYWPSQQKKLLSKID